MYIPHEQFFYFADELEIIMLKRKHSLKDCINVMQIMKKSQDLSLLVFYIPELSFTIDMEQRFRMAKPDFNLIDYRLSDQELDQFDKWADENKLTIPQILSNFAEKAYKISFTYVISSQAWCISVTGQKDAKFNSGATLTTWGDESLESLYMAYFKVFVVFEGGIWKTKTQSRRG
jgi:hypothetical protein